MSPRPGFLEQIERAKAEIRQWKQHMPYLLPQWQRLKAAEAQYETAKQNLERAQKEWDAVGKD